MTQNERALEWFNNLPIRTDNYDHTAHIKTIRHALQQNEKLDAAERQFQSALAHERSLTEFWSKRTDEEIAKNEKLVYALQIAKRDIGNWVTHEEARDSAIACIDKHLAEYEKEIV